MTKQDFIKSMPNMTSPEIISNPTEFVYQSDMDENGAFYFLGTNGRKRLYQNPAAIG